MLKAAGFRHVRTERSGHAHYELGKHRIMVSPGSQDIKDASTAQRIEKLCRGDLTARDLQREAHQQKGELPNNLFRIGDKVEHTEDPSRGEGIVHSIDWQVRTCSVNWRTFTSKNVPIGQLRLVQSEEATMPEEKSVAAEIEELEDELELPLIEEKKTPETRTLLDELQNLELSAEIELEDLVIMRDQLLKRVDAYERVYSLSEQLGISVKKLPWKEIPEYPKHIPVTVEVDVEGLHEHPPSPVVEKPEEPPAELPTSVTRIDGDQIVLEYIKTHGGSISKMAVGHLKIISNIQQHLEALVQSGHLRYSTEPDKAKRSIGRWTIAKQ
mgnify:CR=1 FL=1